MLLTYVSKRIHFSSCTFNMRIHLAVLDWVWKMCDMDVHCNGYMYGLCLLLLCLSQNENVNRAYTSTHRVADLRRPDWRTAMKVLVDKTYNFVDALWEAYMENNKNELR